MKIQRVCGMNHSSPVCCPCCKSIAPAYAVFKGTKPTKVAA